MAEQTDLWIVMCKVGDQKKYITPRGDLRDSLTLEVIQTFEEAISTHWDADMGSFEGLHELQLCPLGIGSPLGAKKLKILHRALIMKIHGLNEQEVAALQGGATPKSKS